MDLNEKYNYKPYEGGAGPSEKETRLLNVALFNAVTNEGGVPLAVYNEDTEQVHVQVEGRTMGYDRWGYCDDDGADLDQVDLDTAVKYLLTGEK